MDLSEKKHLAKCLSEVERKSGLGDYKNWTIREYDHLSVQLEEATRIRISSSTLKRLFKGSGSTRPQLSTLNALAQYIAYKDWYEYVKRDLNTESGEQKDQPPVSLQKTKTYPKWRTNNYWYIIGISLISASIIIAISIRNRNNINLDIPFSAELKLQSGVPNTVTFNYNLDSISYDSAWITIGMPANININLPPASSKYSKVLYYPGQYNCKLFADEIELASNSFIIPTYNWMALIRKNLDDYKPIYVDLEGPDYSTLLYVSPEQIVESGVDISEQYIVSYNYYGDFKEVDGDNLLFKTRIRSSLEEGGQNCQHIWVNLVCENDEHWVSLVEPRCIGIVDVKFSDQWLEGEEHDLSVFGADLDQWQDIQIRIRNRKVNIKINQKDSFEIEYSEPAGKLIGIHFQFLGTGSVDFFGLYDEDNIPVIIESSN